MHCYPLMNASGKNNVNREFNLQDNTQRYNSVEDGKFLLLRMPLERQLENQTIYGDFRMIMILILP